jgi:SAM-dependent methyltransferase
MTAAAAIEFSGDPSPAQSCGICGSSYLSTFLDMGAQPLAERYGDHGDRYPLKLVRCQSCTLVQLAYPWPSQRELFPLDHPYATGNTDANLSHFKRLAVAAGWNLSPGDAVLDIGANDGTLLSMFGDGIRRIAVEPTGQSAKIDGAAVYREFFTVGTAQRIRREHGQVKLITACNVLAHVPDPHDFMSGVAMLLAPGGSFVTENHDLRSLTQGLQIDTVYHEHLRYYDLTSLGRLLTMHGLAADEVMKISMHGGSFRVTARKTAHADIQLRAARAGRDLHRMLEKLTGSGARVYGVSAATRATPLMYFAGITRFITCVCEAEGSEKIGLTMPGTAIPVVPDGRLIADQPEYALLFCWHIAASVVPLLRAAGYRGKFIVPLPEPEVIDD